MKGTYGPISKQPLAYYDPDSLSWKTYEVILDLDFGKSLPTLPLSGMTCDGLLYELVTLERPTEGKDYLSLPTPTPFHTTMHNEPIEVFQARQARSSTGQIGKSTGVALRMLSTPAINASHTTGECRNWGNDLLHDLKCTCKTYQIRWIMVK